MLQACAIEDDGERECTHTEGMVLARLLIVELPSRIDVDNDVTAVVGIIAIVQFCHVVAATQKLGGSIDIPYSRILEEELLRSAQNIIQTQMLLVNKLAVEEDFIPKASLYVTALSIDGTQINVHQVGRTIDVEHPGWNLVFGIVGLHFIVAACACDNKEDIVLSNLAFYLTDEVGQRAIQTQVVALSLDFVTS